jgi:hypothetical protein
MQPQGIAFRQCKNAFLQCADPQRLQQLADSLTAQDLLRCGQKWLTAFTPFFNSQNDDRPAVNTGSSFPRSSFATT